MNQQQTTPKIHHAVNSAWSLVRSIHREGVDRCCVATFGDTFQIRADFTTSLPELAAILTAIGRGVKDEGTRLYDSVADMINAFWKAGRRDRPWVFLILTDGMDNRSKKYPCGNPNSPEMIGRYIGTRFNHEPTNCVALFGVGSDRQLNEKALATMSHFGNFPAVRVEAFPLLEPYLKRLAYEVTGEVEDVYIPLGGGVVGQVRNQNVRVTRRPIDYAILLDVSASMADPA